MYGYLYCFFLFQINIENIKSYKFLSLIYQLCARMDTNPPADQTPSLQKALTKVRTGLGLTGYVEIQKKRYGNLGLRISKFMHLRSPIHIQADEYNKIHIQADEYNTRINIASVL